MYTETDEKQLQILVAQARAYLTAYEIAHQEELSALKEDANEWEATVPVKHRWYFSPPSNFAQTLALLIHHLDKAEKPLETTEPFALRLRRVLQGKHILDIGARHGVFVKFLCDEGIDAQGIDPNRQLIRLVNKHRIAVYPMGYEDLIASQLFDAVVTTALTSPTAPHDMNFSERDLARKIAGALKPGGFNANIVSDKRNAMRPEYLESAGLQVIHHGELINRHVALARKP